MVKRLAVILLVMAVVFGGIAGCSGKKKEAAGDSGKSQAPSGEVRPAEPSGDGKTADSPGDKKTEGSRAGVEQSPGADNLKAVALKEKEFLADLHPQYKKIGDLFRDLEKGSIDRAKLNSQLLAIKPEVEKLAQRSSDFYKSAVLSESDKKNPLYSDGLSNGGKMRTAVLNIISTTVEGRKVINLQQKDASGEYLRETIIYNDTKILEYFAQQDKKYQEYLVKLNKSLESFR